MSYFFHKFIVTYNATKSTYLVKFFNIFLNILTNPAFDPIAKIPEFKVCAVKIEKLNHQGPWLIAEGRGFSCQICTYGLNLKFQKAIRGQAGCQHHPIDITMRYPAASFPVCTLKPERLAKGKRDVHKFINSCFSPVQLPFLWLFFLSFTKIVNSG